LEGNRQFHVATHSAEKTFRSRFCGQCQFSSDPPSPIPLPKLPEAITAAATMRDLDLMAVEPDWAFGTDLMAVRSAIGRVPKSVIF
jgi:hypothetical protein